MHTLCFDLNWPTRFVETWAGFASGEQFLAALADKGFVFAMSRDDYSKLFRQLKRAVKFRVIHPERAFVCEEDFKRADATFHDFP